MRINCLVEAVAQEGDVVVLSSEQSHHLARVLRVEAGQSLRLFDGRGAVADAVVVAAEKRAVTVSMGRGWLEPAPKVEIELLQAVPKLDRWEWVLQKAVELGVSAIRPMVTAHTECRVSAKKMDRWRQIIRQAAEQCEARWLPVLHEVVPMAELLEEVSLFDRAVVGSLYPGTVSLREVAWGEPKRVGLLIGPEGDFTREEVDAWVEQGVVAVGFGSQVLRTETAAIYGLSILAHELRY
tara:strand:- start:11579 stop:12295 length:717 start_codon:yes stop_codon:yes gene_type:complete